MCDLEAIRDAAEKEALGEFRYAQFSMTHPIAFIRGAVWAVGRLPSRDEIAAMIEEHDQCIDWGLQDREDACWCGWDGGVDEFPGHIADAVLELIRQNLTKEDNDNT